MFDIKRFVAVVPTAAPDLRRLNELLRTADAPPRIAVVGKYNHGKSMLLNALVGTDHFKVSDKRETVATSKHEHDGVVWIDTPGLDADPAETDDRRARKAAVEIADFRFVVHQVRDGDLDRHEIDEFRALAKQDWNYRKKMALVLTKIDDLDPAEVCVVEKRCRKQLQDYFDLRELDIMSVSAVRYQNPKLRRLSGMDDVFAKVERLRADIAALRRREWSRLTDGVVMKLREKRRDTQSELEAARRRLEDITRQLQSSRRDVGPADPGGVA